MGQLLGWVVQKLPRMSITLTTSKERKPGESVSHRASHLLLIPIGSTRGSARLGSKVEAPPPPIRKVMPSSWKIGTALEGIPAPEGERLVGQRESVGAVGVVEVEHHSPC